MKKKICSVLILLAMALALLPFSAAAVSGTYGDGLHWELSDDGTLTITGSGAMPDYTQDSLVMDENIDEQSPTPWLQYDSTLRAVVIGEGITHIGDYTFMNDRQVTRVRLPSTLRSIGKKAFSLNALESLSLPEGLQSIGQMAFAGGRMERIVIPASVTELGVAAFEGCDRAEVIKILGPVKELPSRAFSHCRPTDLFLSKEIRSMAPDVFDIDAHVFHIFFDGSRARYLENTRNLNAFHGIYIHPNVELNLEPQFSDVPDGTWYSESVCWAAERSFTTGVTPTVFSPGSSCTRAQTVTFLWRYCGSPEMKNAVNPFEDVHESDYFYQAVLWALERGITKGTSGHTFSPSQTVTRAETVTFFWRLRSQEMPGGRVKTFRDVPQNAYYAFAVDWAVDSGLTKGVSETEFGPGEPCTRAQIVTFLQRFVPPWWG